MNHPASKEIVLSLDEFWTRHDLEKRGRNVTNPKRKAGLELYKTFFFDSWYFSAGTRMPSAARPSRSVNCQTGQGWISYGGLQRVPGRRSKQLHYNCGAASRLANNSTHVHIHFTSARGFYFVKSNGYSIRTVWIMCLICFITQIYLTHKNIRK